MNHSDNPFAAPRHDAEPEPPLATPEPIDDDVVPYLDIWFRPHSTVRWLSKYRPGHRVFVLSMVNGLATLQWSEVSTENLLLHALMGLLFNGLFATVVMGFLLTAIGRLFNGTGSFIDVVTAYTWGSAPNLLHFGTLAAAVAGTPLFTGPAYDLFVVVLVGFTLLVMIWAFVWQALAVSAAHGFGWFEAAVSLAVPKLFWLTAMFILMMLAQAVLDDVIFQ